MRDLTEPVKKIGINVKNYFENEKEFVKTLQNRIIIISYSEIMYSCCL